METQLNQYTGGSLSLEYAVPESVPRGFKSRQTSTSPDPRAVLKELFELLEEYGPFWYTEELHIRARIALSQVH